MEFRQMTEEEASKLGVMKMFYLVIGTVIAAIALIVSAVFWVYYSKSASDSKLGMLLTAAIAAASFLGSIVYFFAMSGRCNADLRQGTTAVLTGAVTAKITNGSASNMRYAIRLEGKRFSVSRDEYHRHEKGQVVEIRYAPRSRRVFGIGTPDGSNVITVKED